MSFPSPESTSPTNLILVLQDLFIVRIPTLVDQDNFHNPNLGLTTKARACKAASQKRSLGVTFHVSESVGECEGMNFHTPK